MNCADLDIHSVCQLGSKLEILHDDFCSLCWYSLPKTFQRKKQSMDPKACYLSRINFSEKSY